MLKAVDLLRRDHLGDLVQAVLLPIEISNPDEEVCVGELDYLEVVDPEDNCQ